MKLVQTITAVAILFVASARLYAAVPDFELPKPNGQVFRSADFRGKGLVVAFLGIECPLAKLYAVRLRELADRYAGAGIQFVAIDANEQDTPTQIAELTSAIDLRFPMLHDAAGDVARSLGATRSPEVMLLNAAHEIVYRGRIDDQYEPGARRPQPVRADLQEAIEDFLAGRAVRVPQTTAVGCLLNLRQPETNHPKVAAVRFAEVKPIFERHCMQCHQPGEVAPFSLRTSDEARPWASTIREVIEQRRMPPWHANPRFGHFANERRLSDGEREQLLAWVRSVETSPQNETEKAAPPAEVQPAAATIASPDVVIRLPEPIAVPATGVMEYQYVTVDPHFSEEVWVQAAELVPGNRGVVHHVTAYLSPPGATNLVESGDLQSYCLATYVPGQEAQVWPPGVAKRIPKGWRLVFVVHYVPNGTPQTDRTELRLKLINVTEVRKELATKVMIDWALKIPPHDSDYRVEQTWQVPADMLLYAMFPHMHLRGKSFRYEVTYPTGEREILLDVPHYDFNWQHRYVLAEPKRLPAGSVLRCTAIYDNSSANPNNPDPSATVVTGEQSSDEMFNGYFDVALADQDWIADARWKTIERALYTAAMLLLGGTLGWSAFSARRRHPA